MLTKEQIIEIFFNSNIENFQLLIYDINYNIIFNYDFREEEQELFTLDELFNNTLEENKKYKFKINYGTYTNTIYIQIFEQ